MRNNVLLVVNPVSGGVDKTAFIDAALQFATKENLKLELYQTSGSNDVLKIKTLFDQLNPVRVIIVGGDGTVKLVTEALDDQDVIIGILPAGSANGLATDLNLPLLPEKIYPKSLRWYGGQCYRLLTSRLRFCRKYCCQYHQQHRGNCLHMELCS